MKYIEIVRKLAKKETGESPCSVNDGKCPNRTAFCRASCEKLKEYSARYEAAYQKYSTDKRLLADKLGDNTYAEKGVRIHNKTKGLKEAYVYKERHFR